MSLKFTVPAAKESRPPQPPAKGAWRGHLREYGMILSLAVIVLFFEKTTNGALLLPLNLTNLVLQNSYIVIMALGMLLVIVAGHIDLSVGSVSGFIGALAAVLMVQFHLNFILTSLLCLAAGALIGAAQGYWIAYFKIPSFIVTLAGMLVFRGLCLVTLAGQSIGPFPVDFQKLSSGFLPDVLAGGKLNVTSLVLTILLTASLVGLAWRNRVKRLENGISQESPLFFWLKHVVMAVAVLGLGYLLSSYKGLPNVLIIMIVLIALYTFATLRTTIGRRIYALGGNEKAARLSGINTERLTFLTFVNMGVLAALAGLVFAARLNTATPKAGLSFELDVIAACFIGGASASGGVGKVTGAVIGAFIMGIMNNGMSIVGVGIDWQQVIKGLVLLAAVCFDVYNRNRS
ncbi:MAG TPA: multiple monosaccharide ABC transporter permease [Aliidongia sp.]|uniref:multiple monosaccharide ABC transporter permease n=1 Tax=Aliidongia sp. TaxID=1914230 RepID=UPI002DDDA93A|nr:multiple monosaccharide ABC transporter permease [Aliidongia sp.]HEV2675894.1 multiple monosaccharide ABC transporter permease [Aliidongia sp.]